MKFEEFLKNKGVSQSDYEAMDAKEVAKLHSQYNDSIRKEMLDKFDNVASEKDVKELTKSLETLEKSNKELTEKTVKELQDTLKAQGLEITALKEKGVDGDKQKTILDIIVENKDSIEKSAKEGEANFVINKANFLRAGVTNSTQAFRIDEIGQIAIRRFTIRELFQVVPVGTGSNGVIRYTDWDDASIVRAAATVAEGGTFAESTAVFEERTLNLKKIGDTIPMSEEVLFDAPRFAAELNSFLEINVALEEDDQLYDGDGTGSNLTGIFTTAEEFVAVASGITDANVFDLIIKMKENMTTGKRSKFQPDFVLMNAADITLMTLKKDGDKNYIMPPFVNLTTGGFVVDGVRVIESAAVTADTMVMGDSRWAKIYEVEGFNITTGHSGTQFVADLITVKAKKREAILIRNVDKGAFKKETGIAAALVTLAI